MDFTVNRSTWNRGGSGVLKGDGGMCCLGHCAINMGIPEDDIEGECTPIDLEGKASAREYLEIFTTPSPLKDVCTANNSLSGDAMCINDDHQIIDEEREFQLQQLFVKHKHTITFED